MTTHQVLTLPDETDQHAAARTEIKKAKERLQQRIRRALYEDPPVELHDDMWTPYLGVLTSCDQIMAYITAPNQTASSMRRAGLALRLADALDETNIMALSVDQIETWYLARLEPLRREASAIGAAHSALAALDE